jgi:hypothetical protein
LFTAGILLFLLAMLAGLIFPQLANPQMGLSGHLGTFWRSVLTRPGFDLETDKSPSAA